MSIFVTFQLVELLLKHGANPLQPNAKGKTPLDVAPSAEMVKILKKETIYSGSDTSSIEDVRSPMSPDSIISMKDDEKSLDSEGKALELKDTICMERTLKARKYKENAKNRVILKHKFCFAKLKNDV